MLLGDIRTVTLETLTESWNCSLECLLTYQVLGISIIASADLIYLI